MTPLTEEIEGRQLRLGCTADPHVGMMVEIEGVSTTLAVAEPVASSRSKPQEVDVNRENLRFEFHDVQRAYPDRYNEADRVGLCEKSTLARRLTLVV